MDQFRVFNPLVKPRISRRTKMLSTAIVLSALVALTGCGSQSSGSSGSSDNEALDAPDPTGASSINELYELAKKEGEVIWFAPKPESQMKSAINAFKKTYPGINVKYSNKKAPDLVSQVKLEQAAKSVSFDVSNAGGLTVVPSQKLADSADWESFGVPDEQIFSNNLVYIWAVPKVWAYNNSAVSDSAVPTSWEELLDPQWAGGKVAVESRGSFMTAWMQAPELGEDAALDFAKRLSESSPHFTENTTQSHSQVASGQSPIGTSLVNLVLEDQDKGAPIEIAPISPTNANKAYLYVPEGSPHPAAGRLLTSFLASAEGQKELAKSYNSTIPETTDCSVAGSNKVVKALCDAGVEWYGETDMEQYRQFSEFFPRVEEAMGTDLG